MDCASHKTVNPRNLTTVPPAGNFVEEMSIAEAQWNKEYEEEKAARVAAQAAADAREQAQVATELWEEAQIEAKAVADAEAYEQAQAEARAINYARAQAEEAAGMQTLMAQAQAQAQAAAADQDMENVEELQPPVRKVGRPRNSSRALSRSSTRSMSRVDYSEPPDEQSEELEPFVRKVCRPPTSNPVRKAESKNQKSNKKTAPSWAYIDEDEIKPTQEEIFERIARQSS